MYFMFTSTKKTKAERLPLHTNEAVSKLRMSRVQLRCPHDVLLRRATEVRENTKSVRILVWSQLNCAASVLGLYSPKLHMPR
jgi:hypothetical protein